jgi:hypothetical protein
MKSFKQFISEKRSEEIERLRQQLQNTPFLTDDEMRSRNPQATAGFERVQAEREKIKTPEKGVTVEVGGKGRSAEGKIPIQTRDGRTVYVSPEEAILRAEEGVKKSQRYNKPVTKSAATPNIPLNRQPAPKPNVGPSLSVSTPSRVIANTQQSQRISQARVATQTGRRLRTPRGARPSVITPSALEKALTKNRQQTALAQQAQNTRAAVQNAKALKNVARVGTGVAAYFDFQRASQAAKERGAGERRATARGAVEAGARVLGTTAGFIAGTPLGPVGQTVGGIGGGEYAVKKSGQAFERIFGKPGDAVTTQSVKRNIKSVVREKIPQNIRSQVPTSVKKGFSDFLNTAAGAAKKGYNLYTKGKKLMDFSNPGDKK